MADDQMMQRFDRVRKQLETKETFSEAISNSAGACRVKEALEDPRFPKMDLPAAQLKELHAAAQSAIRRSRRPMSESWELQLKASCIEAIDKALGRVVRPAAAPVREKDDADREKKRDE